LKDAGSVQALHIASGGTRGDRCQSDRRATGPAQQPWKAAAVFNYLRCRC